MHHIKRFTLFVNPLFTPNATYWLRLSILVKEHGFFNDFSRLNEAIIANVIGLCWHSFNQPSCVLAVEFHRLMTHQ